MRGKENSNQKSNFYSGYLTWFPNLPFNSRYSDKKLLLKINCMPLIWGLRKVLINRGTQEACQQKTGKTRPDIPDISKVLKQARNKTNTFPLHYEVRGENSRYPELCTQFSNLLKKQWSTSWTTKPANYLTLIEDIANRKVCLKMTQAFWF